VSYPPTVEWPGRQSSSRPCAAATWKWLHNPPWYRR